MEWKPDLIWSLEVGLFMGVWNVLVLNQVIWLSIVLGVATIPIYLVLVYLVRRSVN